MKRAWNIFVCFACLAVIAMLLLPGPLSVSAQQGEPIKIGAVISLTGPGAGLGQPERNGMLLAEKVINEKGGIGGRPIKILIEDDGSKPDNAKSKAERLIFEEKVLVMLGPSLTASTGAVSAITNAEGMAELACTGLGPKIELTYKTLYHLLPPQQLNARAMLEYTTQVLNQKRVGVLHDTGYGQVVMNSLNNLKGDYGVEFVSEEKFEVGATDTSAQAAKVRAADPEVVFIVATSPVPFRNAREVRSPNRSCLPSAPVHTITSAGWENLRTISCSRSSSSARIQLLIRRISSSDTSRNITPCRRTTRPRGGMASI